HIVGCDMYFCDSTQHKEKHIDGLHIYHNPYASIPLNRKIFNAKELTYNGYNISNGNLIVEHNDGSLVSRNTYVTF
ncbi:hypothetical protein NLN82_21935, partial [Citrobacter portucalensis]|nr:hypothetical protein [Citrobacter portucalensis]